jgi:hypothetical protein
MNADTKSQAHKVTVDFSHRIAVHNDLTDTVDLTDAVATMSSKARAFLKRLLASS